ncbi:RNA-dependent RNA polymerase [Paramyrothecium foliicola]|nr:RNA-dependent RNA polymerase [Paramyrothecium foliicola]
MMRSHFSVAMPGFLSSLPQFVQELSDAAAVQYANLFLASAKFGRRFLVITFPDASRMSVSFTIVESWVVNVSSTTLTMILKEPPRCFKSVGAVIKTVNNGPKASRCLHVPSWPDHGQYIANCLVYQIAFVGNDFNELVDHLNSIESVSLTDWELTTVTVPKPFTEDYGTAYEALQRRMLTLENQDGPLPYPIRFQVHSLVDSAQLHPLNALKLLKIMENIFSTDFNGGPVPFTVKAVRPHSVKIPFASPGHRATDFDPQLLMTKILKEEAKNRRDGMKFDSIYGGLPLAASQFWVFKAMVTPTRIKLEGPELQRKNRVIRMYERRTDHFLRVIFCEENGQELQIDNNISNNAVFERYRMVFRNGIRAAGRHFSFLAYSHSSLRANTAWFVAPFLDENQQIQNWRTILKSLGNFTHRSPAKCAARIGQAFSETPYAVRLSECGIDVSFMDDVKSADGFRVFSDGIGTVSRDALKEILRHLPRASMRSTCLQIRLGGVKGMLSLNSELHGKVIWIRKESMMKFESDNMDELGICNMGSKPLKMYLNRQLIKIMEDMGTKKGWFHRQLGKAVKELQEVVANSERASSFLESQGIGVNMGFPWFIQQLQKAGVDFNEDEFLRSILEHAILRELRRLKHKAKIQVRQGVTLFGVLDEYSFLEEGQIYVTYDRKHRTFWGGKHVPIRDGNVLITRSPALHPGDVRIVQHVTPPANHPLRKLGNCIVFSQKGSRDLPSQLGGGDLDGDLYSVIWDPGAIPMGQFTPANYPREDAAELGRDVTQEDIADHFIDCMKTQKLGIIAIRHQIIADIKPLGTRDEESKKLAELHSAAVDYAKTGKVAELGSLPKAPKTRPDFLAPIPPKAYHNRLQLAHVAADESDAEGDELGFGRTKPKYHLSEKILGELYRAVDERRIWKRDIAPRATATGTRRQSVWSQVFELVESRVMARGLKISFEHKLQEARRLRKMYESAILDKMWEHSESSRKSLSEQEVFCGSILNKKSAQTRRQRDFSLKLREQMERIGALFVRLIRGQSKAEDGSSGDLEGANEMEATRSPENDSIEPAPLDCYEVAARSASLSAEPSTVAMQHISRPQKCLSHETQPKDGVAVSHLPTPLPLALAQESSNPWISHFVALPPELQIMTLSHLDFGDVERLRRTCRFLRTHISKPMMRVIFRDLQSAILSTCSLCISSQRYNKDIVLTEPTHVRHPFSSKCVRCLVVREEFMVDTKYTLGCGTDAYICRLCGYPVLVMSDSDDHHVHTTCQRSYLRRGLLFYRAAFIQALAHIIGTSLCWAFYDDQAVTLGCTTAIFFMAIWAFLLFYLRRLSRLGRHTRTWHWSCLLEVAMFALWVLIVYDITKPTNGSRPRMGASAVATLTFAALNLVIRALNSVGFFLMVCEIKYWQRNKPDPSRLSRLFTKFITTMYHWTYPDAVHQQYPAFWFKAPPLYTRTFRRFR